MKIVIVAGGTMYGPFPNTTAGDDWLESHSPSSGGEDIKIFSMWDDTVEEGTAEKAQACGVLLGRNRALENLRPEERKQRLIEAAGGVRNA